MKKVCSIVVIWLISVNSSAQWSDSINQAWEKTKQTSNEIIQDSSQLTKNVIDRYFSEQDVIPDNSQRIKEIWEPLLEKLHQGSKVRKQIAETPSFTFWGEDKEAVIKDYQDIIDQIIMLLRNPSLEKNRNAIRELKNRIETLNNEISQLKEQRIVAPIDDSLTTTKSEIDKKIAQRKKQIDDDQDQIDHLLTQFKIKLTEMGIDLNRAQIEMLLVRVDADDIVQMFAVLDILKEITQQLSQLLNESQEDLLQARRYYGMHLILLEMVAQMQQTYLGHIDTLYVPNLEQLYDKTLTIQANSKERIQQDNNINRKKIYQRNIKAQDLTLKIIKIYIKQLLEQKSKIMTAQDNLKKDIDLAQNTYNTVMISSELSHLLQTSIEAFDTLQQIQLPEIIPFENIQMQKKYAELSRSLDNN